MFRCVAAALSLLLALDAGSSVTVRADGSAGTGTMDPRSMATVANAGTRPSSTANRSRILLSDLPWENLSSQLSPTANFLVGSSETYIAECVKVFEEYGAGITQWDLHASGTSGLCMNALSIAYEQCIPVNFSTGREFRDIAGYFGNYNTKFLYTGEVSEVFFDSYNPRFNLPYKVLQPTNAGDVVRAVRFAAEHGVEISVKNSGHNYNGASTNRDSILIYTPSLPKYSATDFHDCTVSTSDTEVDKYLSNQPCILARARKTNGAIRVGGGENFSDLYSKVVEMNNIALDKTGSYKYHPVGGYASTVTPMGWTFQGGLGGSQNGRTLGFGTDQVLQIEMVLPDGSHVIFGPTEWEDASADGYKYPKTTKVTGVCNENPFAESESDYVWVPCTNGVNFNDLWYAVRGGGGGTWGVVLSMHLQLHEYQGAFRLVTFDWALSSAQEACKATNTTEADCKAHLSEIKSVLAGFYVDFWFDPTEVTGLSPDISKRCGAPGIGNPHCFGGRTDEIVLAWKIRLMEKAENLIDSGVPKEMIKSSEAAVYEFGDELDYWLPGKFEESHRHNGKFKDPAPGAVPITVGVNPIIPRTVLLKNKAYWVEYVSFIADASAEVMGGSVVPFYLAHADKTDDQMSSLSTPHHKGAVMAFDMLPVGSEFASKYGSEKWFPMIFEGMDFNGDFPGVFGSNHITPDALGPIKIDWTKPCPWEWSNEKREEECIPQQEAVWGTKTLRSLEQIKANIDPLSLFNCFGCISAPASKHESSKAKKSKIKKSKQSKKGKTKKSKQSKKGKTKKTK